MVLIYNLAKKKKSINSRNALVYQPVWVNISLVDLQLRRVSPIAAADVDLFSFIVGSMNNFM